MLPSFNSLSCLDQIFMIMKVSVRPPKHHYDVISTHCVSKLAYFIVHGIGYQTLKFG